jgi:TetR/AcrR family fatty acid metabolism transcriptional regulator
VKKEFILTNYSTDKKKTSIIEAALDIFAEKGYENTKISELAKIAGVSEATIYEYFESKEDLLFNIPIENTKLLIKDLNAHLIGIKGAENKLRKLIWHYLSFLQGNKAYASIVLFELRPNKNFYKSQAYEAFKEYNKILVNILKEGQEEGIFHKKINIPLCRNLIFGSIDHILYSWLIFKKPENLLDQADSLFDLVQNVLRSSEKENPLLKREHDKDELIDKKKNILRSAAKLIAEKGFSKTTISDISKVVSMGDATLYEYFQNKEDILFNIPIERTELLIDSLNRHLNKKNEGESKLRKFLWHYISFLQQNKDYVAILLFELRPNRRFYSSNGYKLFKDYNEILIPILKQGQEEKTFRTEANIYLFRNLIFGTIDHTALTWLLFGRPANLIDQREEMIQYFIRTIKSSEENI